MSGEDRAVDGATADDPVRVARARWARWGAAGKRVGYGLVLLSIVVFLAGVATGFTTLIAAVVTVCLVGSIFTLAPGLVIGYAVKKAEREDPEPRRR
ncbi:MAG: hypothetical protein ACR2MO_03810 [Acidimicrobiales bacterium]